MALITVAAVPAGRSSHGAERDKNPAWSPDGTLIAFNLGVPPEKIWVAKPDGTGHRKLTRDDGPEAQPSWSPDGRRIAITSAPAGNWDIYVIDADGSDKRRVTTHPLQEKGPAWSPDGSQIAYYRHDDASTSSEIRVVKADGSGDRLLAAGARSEFPSWSPDGNRIAFQSTRDGNWELYVMNADGSGVRRLTTAPYRREDEPAWSPDGTRIAFSAGTDHMPRDIYVVDADGSNEQQLTHRGRPVWHLSWSPDGSQIAFFEFPSPGATIYLMNADGSGVTRLFSRLSVAGFSVTPRSPRAGTTFAAFLRVAGPSETATPSCRASVAGQTLRPLARTFAAGRARCAWRVPPTARGKRLRATIGVSAENGRAARSFSAIVR